MKNRFILPLAVLLMAVSVSSCSIRINIGGFYSENPDWSVYYLGRNWDPVYGLSDYVGVSVTAGHESYLVGWETVDEFERLGIKEVVDNWLYEYGLMLDDPFGGADSWSDLSYRGNAEIAFDAFAADEPCVAVVFGIYSNGEPTGSYAVSRPFVPGDRTF